MANHEWHAALPEAHLDGAAAGVASGAATTAILVNAGEPEAGLAGCGSAGGFGAGGLVALPVVLAAALLRRRSVVRARRAGR